MAKKTLELIAARKLHPAASIQNPLKRRQDIAGKTIRTDGSKRKVGVLGCDRMDQQNRLRTHQTRWMPDAN
jgi:hypothetical protein